MYLRKKEGISRAVLVLVPFTALWLATLLGRAQEKPAAPAAANGAAQSEAKQTFESVCAACHGLDARGSERGPDVATRQEAVQKTDAELGQILANGKPASGMPSFAGLGPERLSALVSYIRSLQGRGKEAVLPGDPGKGKSLFYGKAKCAECHSVAGQGGFFASDLTSSGRLGLSGLRAKIVAPDADLDPRRGLVRVVLADGTELTGAVRNESNFSLQLQSFDGTFHLLNKSDLRSQSYVGATGMPRDYESSLSPDEVNDVISYLLRSVAQDPQPVAKPAGGDDN